MPELDIGASQAEYIEELREALADEYLDGYGAMRPRDALQYLIDRHEATRPAAHLVPDASDNTEPAADDAASDTSETSSVGDAAAAMADANATVETMSDDGGAAIDPVDTEVTDAEVGTTDTTDADDTTAADAGSGTAESDADDATTTTDTANAPPASGGPPGSGSPLRQMMELLEEHDDAWEEVDSSDGKYRVTLPDGSSEHARTRDDVRALLFKHYR